jgi:hypothetical protein
MNASIPTVFRIAPALVLFLHQFAPVAHQLVHQLNIFNPLFSFLYLHSCTSCTSFSRAHIGFFRFVFRFFPIRARGQITRKLSQALISFGFSPRKLVHNWCTTGATGADFVAIRHPGILFAAVFRRAAASIEP